MKKLHSDYERLSFAKLMVCEEEDRLNREIRELENITPPTERNNIMLRNLRNQRTELIVRNIGRY